MSVFCFPLRLPTDFLCQHQLNCRVWLLFHHRFWSWRHFKWREMVIEWDFMVVEWSLSHFPNSSGQIPILSIVTHKESPLFMVKHHFRCSNLRELRPRDAKWIHILSPCWAWPRAECLGIRGHVESCSTQQLWCDDPQWTRSVNVKCTVKVNCLLISINVYQCLSISINVYQSLSIWKMIFYPAVCSDHSQFTTL